MHEFHFRGGRLFCENIRVEKIADKIGTPFYLYSQKTVIDHYTKIKNAFQSIPSLICYALKANSNLAILKTLANVGCGADIVSSGELYKALKAGIPIQKIVYAGVGKTKEEIKYALEKNILMFNIESLPEANMIDSVAQKTGKKARVALRINPGVDPHTHHYVATGESETKFGINIQIAEVVIKRIKKLKNLSLVGLHVHIGSQITSPAPYIKTIKRINTLLKRLRQENIEIEWLDLGGGMGIIYHEEKPSTADSFANAVLPQLKMLNCKIILEPGRFIVGNAGILVTKILYFKKTPFKKFLIVDAGMNDLIRPSLYGSYHEITPVIKNKNTKQRVDIVGPICESADFLGQNRFIGSTKEGELLAVMGAGAYGFSMSSNYNSRKRAAEVLVSGNKFYLIRRRETFADLIQSEIIPSSIR